MKCAARLSLSINDSSVSLIIFVEANMSLILLNQAVCFYFGINTLKAWVFMSHPRQVLSLTIFLSPASFLREGGSSNPSGSYACSGPNSVHTTNKAALFACSIQYLSCTVMIIMLSMNPSIDASLDLMFTARESAFSR